jgi:N,N'-diacetyllegionaminate synthase
MKTFVIAEAGINHNGSVKIARDLVKAASEAGADCIKFQTFKTENLVSESAQMADYQKKNTGKTTSQFEMLKILELSIDDHLELLEYCKELKIQFLSTAFDLESIDLLQKLGSTMWKIPSGEITNYPYLKKIGSFNQEILLSTGMADLGEIEAAINVLENSGVKRNMITLLHCSTEYPASIDQINLNAMLTLADAFKVRIGYSDHSEGVLIPIAAVALGATVIEKHFTLDRNMKGPDHLASLEPDDLKNMVESIRKVEDALGDGIKRPAKGEIYNRVAARKSIIASKEIKKGEIFTEDNLTVKRPGDGISPMLWTSVLGKRAVRDFIKDEKIDL